MGCTQYLADLQGCRNQILWALRKIGDTSMIGGGERQKETNKKKKKEGKLKVIPWGEAAGVLSIPTRGEAERWLGVGGCSTLPRSTLPAPILLRVLSVQAPCSCTRPFQSSANYFRAVNPPDSP